MVTLPLSLFCKNKPMSFNYPYFPAQLTDGQPGGVECFTTASTATFPSHPLPLFFFLFLRLIFRADNPPLLRGLAQNDTNKVS
jgi:hypothetical protein